MLRALRRAGVCPAPILAGALVLLVKVEAGAQTAGSYYPFDALTPAGTVGRVRLSRGGPVAGYFQPVRITAPEGTLVSLAIDGDFAEPQEAPVQVGLLVGAVYRLRVINLPGDEEAEVFPTIEVIDRLYPPAGLQRKFPIPVELSQEDLSLALEGKFVTRVVYLEDPDRALPALQGEHQEWFDAGPGQNPLEIADSLGRPVAIVRMGGKVPDSSDGPDLDFLGGCPPFTVFRPFAAAE